MHAWLVGPGRRNVDKIMTQLDVGARVRLHGLVAKPELNGAEGVCMGMQYSTAGALGRWLVRLDNGSDCACNPKNLLLLRPSDDSSMHGLVMSGVSSVIEAFDLLLSKLEPSRPYVLQAMAYCMDNAAENAAPLAQRLIDRLLTPEMSIKTTSAVLFTISDVLYNARGGDVESSNFRVRFEELLPEACEMLGRRWSQRIRNSEDWVCVDGTVSRIFGAWADWKVFPVLFTRGLQSLLFPSVPEGHKLREDLFQPDAKLTEKLSRWTSCTETVDWAHECRLRGLMGKESRVDISTSRARLCHFERYWHVRPGTTVRLEDYKTQPTCALNGKIGICEKWDWSVSCWRVRLQDGMLKTVRPLNLRVEKDSDEPDLSANTECTNDSWRADDDRDAWPKDDPRNVEHKWQDDAKNWSQENWERHEWATKDGESHEEADSNENHESWAGTGSLCGQTAWQNGQAKSNNDWSYDAWKAECWKEDCARRTDQKEAEIVWTADMQQTQDHNCKQNEEGHRENTKSCTTDSWYKPQGDKWQYEEEYKTQDRAWAQPTWNADEWVSNDQRSEERGNYAENAWATHTWTTTGWEGEHEEEEHQASVHSDWEDHAWKTEDWWGKTGQNDPHKSSEESAWTQDSWKDRPWESSHKQEDDCQDPAADEMVQVWGPSGLEVSKNISAWDSFEKILANNAFPGGLIAFVKTERDKGGCGLLAPAAVHAYTWPLLASGKDLLCVCKLHAANRTFAYLLPSLCKLRTLKRKGEVDCSCGPALLILTSSLELCCDVFQDADRCGKPAHITAACLLGGASKTDLDCALRRGCDLLVTVPDLLADLINNGLRLDQCRVVVLDGADSISAMGYKTQLWQVMEKLPEKRQVTLFMETWHMGCMKLAAEFIRSPVRMQIGKDKETNTLLRYPWESVRSFLACSETDDEEMDANWGSNQKRRRVT